MYECSLDATNIGVSSAASRVMPNPQQPAPARFDRRSPCPDADSSLAAHYSNGHDAPLPSLAPQPHDAGPWEQVGQPRPLHSLRAEFGRGNGNGAGRDLRLTRLNPLRRYCCHKPPSASESLLFSVEFHLQMNMFYEWSRGDSNP
jgi:hypothetical protein